jgi:hypothetical protein
MSIASDAASHAVDAMARIHRGYDPQTRRLRGILCFCLTGRAARATRQPRFDAIAGLDRAVGDRCEL